MSLVAPRSTDPRVARLIVFFETLRPDDVASLGDHYAQQINFKDPFNEVRTLAGVQAVFRHMFDTLHEPRFVVHDVLLQGDQCVLTWDFLFRFKHFNAELQTVRGATHLRFDPQGKISWHRDYWDAAEELYEKLPVVGGLMRWLKRQART